MENTIWKDDYKIGVDFIDKEHKQLFTTVDKLLRISKDEEKSEWACREGVKFLKNHTIEHFEHEEGYMQSIDYEDYEVHKRLHDNFRYKTLPALEEELVETDYSTESIRHFLGVCIGWVVAHTRTEDLAISGKKLRRWVDLPHEKEKDALEQSIIQLIDEMFQLNATLISEQYDGEDFGKVVCIHFVYKEQKKEKWGITLVYEEQLLLQIISRILKTRYKKVDDMIINVMRFLSRQFMEQIRESFPMIGLCEIEKESLLTHEQLTKMFERSAPSCSLLFNTGKGYFAFCAASSESIKGKIGDSMKSKDVMNTIKEYLHDADAGAKNSGNGQESSNTGKKKILVVDDSEFMRKHMINLLEEDYEMLEAKSSLSAIKRLTINRPDLILLDYEMPICDGRQTLEMIRSEHDTADIPVIFLTNRGDRQSVQKVMELKPEGYLLKTMADEDVKKCINDFFANR